jgi:hypothetical protein
MIAEFSPHSHPKNISGKTHFQMLFRIYFELFLKDFSEFGSLMEKRKSLEMLIKSVCASK